jgi:hypothetical protein
MKVPANLPADRLILEYLSRVAAAGNRLLPKGKRMAFVSATRNRIWREIGPSGTADADRVKEVLAGLGEPEDLVRAERARLDAETAERLERQAQKKEAAEAAAAPPGTAPLEYRPRTPRPRPARPPAPWRTQPSDGRGDAGAPARRPGRRDTPGEGKPRRRLGGLLADWQNKLGSHSAHPSQPGGQAPQSTTGQAPQNTTGQAPQSTTGRTPGGTAGQGPGTAPGQGPGTRPGQGPGNAMGQGPGNAPGQGAGTAPGQAPGSATGQPPEGTGGQAPQVTGGQGPGAAAGQGPGTAPGQASSRYAHWIPGFQDTHAPGGTAAPTTNGGGPNGANGVTPAATGTHRNGGTVPAGAGPPAAAEEEEETSALSRGTHALRGTAVTLGNRAVDLALDGADLARQHKLETVAVLLLGVSAFIFVFPFWLVAAMVGGVVAISSQIWNARDKWVGLAGPPVIALVGTIVAALIIGGRGHFIGSLPEAFRVYVGYFYRGGSLACAVYLALQVRRGPQRRLAPWQR